MSSSSSFGEMHAQVRGEYVEESLLKLIPIAPNAAAAFAGDVALASELIMLLRDTYSESATLSELFSPLTTAMGPFDRNRPVEILVATAPTNGPVLLARWDTTNGLDSSGRDFYQIGSLRSYHSALTAELLKCLVASGVSGNRLLAVLTAVVQSFGIHDNLIEQNVGGSIFGLEITAGNVSWQADTNFVLYGPECSNIGFVSTLVRDNVLVLSSSLTSSIRILAHSITAPSISEWQRVWETSITNHLASNTCRYWIFISLLGKCITVVYRNDLQKPSRYIRTLSQGNGKFELALNSELIGILQKPLSPRDNRIPFRLNFRND
jgi:hypothetical protein